MSRPAEITKKLKGAAKELSMYIVELEKENLRLHSQVAKLHVKLTSRDNEIRALKKARPEVKIVVQKLAHQ